MQELERLEKQWNNAARFRGIRANFCLDDEGLTLGAGTLLAKRNHDGSLALDGEEEKVLTLLSIACGKALDPSALKPIRRASEIARDGDECRAAMHVALAKLPNISDPIDAARRLFIAEGLIAAGVAPCDIWKAVGFNPAILNLLAKYNSAEPRVPPGSGKPSGEWTSGGANALDAAMIGATAAVGTAAPTAESVREAAQRVKAQIPKILERLPGIAARIAEYARYADLPLAIAQDVFDPTETGGDLISGPVSGMPNLRYARHQDELAIQLIDKSTGHTVATLYPTRVHGQYVDPQSGTVAQMEGDKLVLRSATNALSEVQAQRKKPQLCPDPPVPDHKGMIGPRGDRSRGYEVFMKEKTNPGEDVTPPGMAFGLENPVTGDLVRFDDCEQKTGDMMEYKGLGIARQLRSKRNRENIAGRFIREATSQVQAAAGRHVVWNFAEQQTMEFARELFEANPLLAGIELRYEPWAEGERWRWSRSKRVWLRALILLRLRKRLLELRNSLRRGAHDARRLSKRR